MSPWLHIIGIGEDGLDGLTTSAIDALESADVIIGGDRHHGLAPHLDAQRIKWPSPFRTLVDEIGTMSDRKVAVLVTGDPTWFSAGAYLAKKFSEDCEVYPNVSGFQHAAARMRWSLADVETLTIHGRPAEQIVPYFSHGARLLVLTQDAKSPELVSKLLVDRGFEESRLTVLGALGGPNETRIDGQASDWNHDAPDFHILAIEVLGSPAAQDFPLIGLPDHAFQHDGQITKKDIRALTVSALNPRRGAVLWDLGAGSGSVGIEFMRMGPDAMTHAVEENAERVQSIKHNAIQLGTPRLKVYEGSISQHLGTLPQPDSVFIGGGLTDAIAQQAIDRLQPLGRLVVNAVTLESETILLGLHARFGGTLTRLQVSNAVPVGRMKGWKPAMPVTQWVFVK